jgi:hypothetical protein
MSELGFEFVYGIPNQASKKMMERAGLQEIGLLRSMVRPVSVKYYLEKHIPPVMATALSPLADRMLKWISRDTYLRPKGIFEEPRSFGEAFERLWKDKLAQHNTDGAIGDRRPSYLSWRYTENPEHAFRTTTFKRAGQRDLAGYLVFCVDYSKLRIYDLIATGEDAAHGLLKKAVNIAREEKCHGIYIDVFERNPLAKTLKLFRFMSTKDDTGISVLGCDQLKSCEWLFFAGDRNI